MGDIKRKRKTYERPFKRWDKVRIEEEKKLIKDYGLKNKREIYKAETIIRKFRAIARKLVGMSGEEAEKLRNDLMGRLHRLKLLEKDASLDDVLSLTSKDLLERRLQTVVFRLGLANTVKQARQFIVHGHVYVKGRKVTSPSYLVKRDEEKEIEVRGVSK